MRARTYEPVLNDRSQKVWLELKQRHDAAIKKIRIELRSEEWDTLLKKGASALWLGIDAGRRAEIAPVIWELVGGVRRPKTFVRYLRRAYLGYTGGERIRLTFDSNLEAAPCFGGRAWYPSSWTAVEPRKVVMEVKFSKSLPAWFGELLRFLELERVSISKYAKSVEAARWYQSMPR